MNLRKISVLGIAVGFLSACSDAGQSQPSWGSGTTTPPTQPPNQMVTQTTTASAGGGGSTSVFTPPDSFTGNGPGGAVGAPGALVRVVPTDDRPVENAATPPPAISGGTLATTADGAYVVVADSDRDRIVIVSVAQRQVVQSVALQPGDEPGRVVAGSGQQAFVALRRGGAVVTVDPTGLLARRPACLAPRGMAYDASNDQLHVACADGKLVTFDSAEDQPSQVLSLDTDLRDVVLVNGRMLISRLRSAELLEIGPEGTVVQRIRPDSLVGSIPVASNGAGGSTNVPIDGTNVGSTMAVDPGVPSGPGTAVFEPAVAWRTVQAADGSVHMLHQRDQVDEIHTHHDDMDVFDNPYGSGSPCSGIVREGISKLGDDHHLDAELAPSVPLAVDLAISPNGHYIAVAGAGAPDANAPQPTFTVPGDPNDLAVVGKGVESSGIQVFSVPDPSATNPVEPNPADANGVPMDPSMAGAGGAFSSATVPQSADSCDVDTVGAFIPEPVVSVAFGPVDNGTVFAQTRSPSQLYFVDLVTGVAEPLALGGDSVADTAHDLFHRSAGAGVACASCHPEGSDDGHVWNFQDVGARRTQALDVGLRGTAPFHWDGELADVSALMDEVFVGRMGGVNESPERIAALENWLFAQKPLPARRDLSDPQAARGQELFNSPAVGCVVCHSGPSFTNNLSYAVGTTPDGAKLQVPSLVGISYRSPLMHNGCAATLMDRFNPACGGDSHGVTSNLPPEDIAALVAYLETL